MWKWDQGSVSHHQWLRAQREGIYGVRLLGSFLHYSEAHLRSIASGRRSPPPALRIGSIGRDGRRRLELRLMGTVPPS